MYGSKDMTGVRCKEMRRFSRARREEAEKYLQQKIRWVEGGSEGCVAMLRGLSDDEFNSQFEATAKYIDVTKPELEAAILNTIGLSVEAIREIKLDTIDTQSDTGL